MKQLIEEINFFLPDPLWRAMPGSQERWVFECRNKDTRRAQIVTAELSKPDEISLSAFDTDWWSSLAGIGESGVFVHLFRDPSIPGVSDLIYYQFLSGDLKWVLPGWRYLGNSLENVPIAGNSRPDGFFIFKLSETDGSAVSSFSENEQIRQPDWEVGARYSLKDQHYELLKNLIVRKTKLEPVGTIEYLDYADRMIFSFYLYKIGKLAQYVAVLDRFRGVEYLAEIEENLEKEGNGILLLKEGRVYFVRNRNNFVGISLTV